MPIRNPNRQLFDRVMRAEEFSVASIDFAPLMRAILTYQDRMELLDRLVSTGGEHLDILLLG